MLASSYPFLDVMWTMLVFFVWILWFWLLIGVFADIFRRHDLSGWGKTGWLIFVIILPFLGVFIYLITQNEGMTERGLERATAQQAAYGVGRRRRWRRRGGDRVGQEAARQRRDHAGRVRRAQAEGARHLASGFGSWQGRAWVGFEPRARPRDPHNHAKRGAVCKSSLKGSPESAENRGNSD